MRVLLRHRGCRTRTWSTSYRPRARHRRGSLLNERKQVNVELPPTRVFVDSSALPSSSSRGKASRLSHAPRLAGTLTCPLDALRGRRDRADAHLRRRADGRLRHEVATLGEAPRLALLPRPTHQARVAHGDILRRSTYGVSRFHTVGGCYVGRASRCARRARAGEGAKGILTHSYSV